MQATVNVKLSREDIEALSAAVAERLAPMFSGLAGRQAGGLDELYTIGEVAEKLKMGTSTIYKMIEEGRFPRGQNLGGSMRRFSAQEVNAWAAQGAAT